MLDNNDDSYMRVSHESPDSFEGEKESWEDTMIYNYACEDCNHQWTVTVSADEDLQDNEELYCAMCGSHESIQI